MKGQCKHEDQPMITKFCLILNCVCMGYENCSDYEEDERNDKDLHPEQEGYIPDR